MSALLFIIAVILVIAGVINIVHGHLFAGLALIVLACLVGPGGYSLYHGG